MSNDAPTLFQGSNGGDSGSAADPNRTDISLYVATERSSESSVSRLVDRVQTGHFATLIHLCLVSETLLRDVIAMDTPVEPVDVLLEEVLAGETSVIAQFVDPDEIDDELTRLESGRARGGREA